MKHLKKFNEKFKDYTGYLSGSLVHLHKHKQELEKEIEGLESKISAQSRMSSLIPSRNKSEMMHVWSMKVDELEKELSEVDMEIKKWTKSND